MLLGALSWSCYAIFGFFFFMCAAEEVDRCGSRSNYSIDSQDFFFFFISSISDYSLKLMRMKISFKASVEL